MLRAVHITRWYSHLCRVGQGFPLLTRYVALCPAGMKTIAVIGAGIGGLAAAALLQRGGHGVTLFERFGTPRPLGSGLVIQPVGLAVLDVVGAGAAARSLGADIARMVGHDGQRKVLSVSYPPGVPGLALHRASLFHALWSVVQEAGLATVMGAAVTAAPLDGCRRRIVLADGSRHGPFDLVVDAQGAGSVLSPLQARPLGYGAIWGHVPWPAATPLDRAELRQVYRRAARMAGILPIGRLPDDPTPRAAVFWSMPLAELAGSQDAKLNDWKADVCDLWPAMAAFLDGITATGQMTPARYAHGTLARPYDTGIVHIGDAAHRASPQLGQGANMALLDAYALAVALQGPWDDALPAYAQMRRWHVRLYQGMSRVFTPMYQSASDVLPMIRNRLLAPLAEWPGIRGGLTRLVSGDLIPPVAGVAFPQAFRPIARRKADRAS
jgi:2-polyprenyl-6-methoxyphenol hydroxylase-like FAD-dependent oxidoreductase